MYLLDTILAKRKYIDPAQVNTNWFNEAFKTGIRQNHNINMSGGGTNNTYNIGLDFYSQRGTMVGAGPNFDRYTARVNNTMDVKFVKIKTNIVYSHSNQDNMALSNANEYVQGLYGAQYPVMASALITPPTIKAYDPSTWHSTIRFRLHLNTAMTLTVMVLTTTMFMVTYV